MAAWTLRFRARNGRLALAWRAIGERGPNRTGVPVPARKWPSSWAAVGAPASSNPVAVVSPRVWSWRSSLRWQAAPPAWARVSWLALGATGWLPLTVKRSAGRRRVTGVRAGAGRDREGSAAGRRPAAAEQPASSPDARIRAAIRDGRIAAHPSVPPGRRCLSARPPGHIAADQERQGLDAGVLE